MPHYSDRTKLELHKFADALATLHEAAVVPEDRMARDSLLLRYVYTFELAWQTMLFVLQDRGDRETPRLAFAVLETGFKVGLVRDPALWKAMRAARNAVVHAYDEGVAMALSAFVRGSAMAELDRLFRALEEGTP
ncbi:nucleotidyltransferase substrate binding protein [Hydrogenophaga sp.]|uniref:nucleotidyltransferase substrate binding protein n=1 Tax=Hydrogenophaga sp. TaxID=1904254 RepID=UPI00199180A3|nr:nucleotidyltransferase substrate binding protein [Hydrogenophaga sp.]MBD3893640.1 hypothetical protein [Hydrogenophaga sp.]